MAGHGGASLGMETGLMASMDPSVPKLLKALRFNKSKKKAAMILKIVSADSKIVVEEEYEEVDDLEELAEELPECQPRYLVYSHVHEHGDGRVTYPLVFIYYCPDGCKPDQLMRYAGSRSMVEKASDIRKVFELRDKEDLNEGWLLQRLKLK